VFFKSEEVAVVTGGSNGIGEGISKVLAAHGAKVVVSGVDVGAGKRVVGEIEASGGSACWIRADVSSEVDVYALFERTVQQFGRVDVLVNNAGIGGYKPITETSMADWEACLRVDLTGVYLGCKHAIPHMQRRGKGAIVNISSVHSIRSVNGCAAYDAAKGGVSALTRQVAIDYGPAVRVNAVSPGWTMSDNVRNIFGSYPDPRAQQQLVEQRQVLKRIGTPEDIGNAVAFLASDFSSFITGAELFVDGGLTCQLERW
jgi:NAD(P)-dependent dehydrogenase (short-subunit alcohol dehydrogenase family)